jgi:hypothetical protein
MATLRSLTRLPRIQSLKRNVASVQAKRNASFYNTDVAGLNEEELEVYTYLLVIVQHG